MKLVHKLTFVLAFIGLYQVRSQTPSATIATWKDNFTGAYSVIHDDFGSASVNGIENYADTIAYNRGIKFTFGAITGSCTAQDWANALTLMSHGHEIMNHSHNHYCGQPVAWCQTSTWDENDFDIEIDQSSSLIEANTGHFPRFYIFPYDLHTDTMLSYLESIDYLGARAGTQSQTLSFANLNDKDFPDPFRVNFFVFGPSTATSDLNDAAQMAIDYEGWAIRELHGVQDASWGSVPEANYRAHMDYCKARQDAGELWCATTSEVISYQTQRLAYNLDVNSNVGMGEITIDFVLNDPELKTHLQICPLTLNVDVDGMPGVFQVFQNGTEITEVSRNGDVLTFNAGPEDGTVTITSGGCPGQSVCITEHPSSQSVNEGQTVVFSANGTSSVTPLSYQWQKDGVNLTGETSSTLTIVGVVEADAGNYTCIISNGIESSTTNQAILSVSAQSPYGGSLHTIPGTIQAEDYDIGGQDVAYYDGTAGNTPNEYRSDDVDIESTTDIGGGYNIGYTATGEWLEYSVMVSTTGSYDFTFRVATDDFGTNGISVDFDEVDVTGNVPVSYTGGWQSWTNINVSGISLSAGQHIMRVNITGVFNLNYIEISTTAMDCNGDPGGTAYIDNCSNCVGGNTGETECTQDCNGDWGGTAYLDNCSNCVGGNTGETECTQDCNGEWGGTAYLDNCSDCVGGNTGATECTQDCNNEWGGTAAIDGCGICAGGSTGVIPDEDTDSDGTPDCFDNCPADPNKTEPGTCGCGTADLDSDSDGTLDCNDNCPMDPSKTDPGTCGCGVSDNDSDSDGTPDCNDLCPTDPNKTAPGDCGCGNLETDSDSDGTPDCVDLCPSDINKTEPGACGCGQAEGTCTDCNGDPGGTAYTDVCGNCVGGNSGQTTQDTDNDGTPDCIDNCPSDPAKTNPGSCGCGVADTDSDSDGTPDCTDNCPSDPSKTEPGTCGCGVAETDSDSDGTPDCTDNCPSDPNKTEPGDCGCGNTETSCLDCNGDPNGTAELDVCNTCAGGNTGVMPETNIDNCISGFDEDIHGALEVYPNPFTSSTNIRYYDVEGTIHQLVVKDLRGIVIEQIDIQANELYSLGQNYPKGVYIGYIITNTGLRTFRVIKN